MALPRQPEHVDVLPLTDPNEVREAFAQDVIVNVIGDVMHITFTIVRPKDFDPLKGVTTNERVITARLVMPVTAANAMADCIRQTLTAITAHQSTLLPN